MPAIPTIHLNGTSRDELLRGYVNALDALREAEIAVAQTIPHGRDFHVQGDMALERAHREHIDRMRKLRGVFSDLSAIAETVAA